MEAMRENFPTIHIFNIWLLLLQLALGKCFSIIDVVIGGHTKKLMKACETFIKIFNYTKQLSFYTAL